eukprot:jgi/Tetstr1/451824/TSEL_038860.t1
MGAREFGVDYSESKAFRCDRAKYTPAVSMSYINQVADSAAFASLQMAPGQHHTHLSMTLFRLIEMHQDGKLADCEWMHFLGISTLKAGMILSRLQKALRSFVAPKLSISFDSSSPFQSSIYATAIVGFERSADRWSFRPVRLGKELLSGGYRTISDYADAWASEDINRVKVSTSIGHGISLNRLFQPQSTKASMNGAQVVLLMNHNIQAYIEGFRKAYQNLDDGAVLDRPLALFQIEAMIDEVKFDSEIASIKQLLAAADKSKAGHHKSLHDALQKAFDFTSTLIKDDSLDLFARHVGIKLGKVAEENPYQPVAKFLFAGSTEESVSKYATVLNHARTTKLESQTFLQWLEKQGGINEAAKAARQAKTRSKFHDLLNETEAVFLDNAKEHLRSHALGEVTIKDPDNIPSEGEFHRAIVRVANGTVELSEFLPSEPKALERDFRKIVRAKPLRAVAEITSNPAYPLFRLIDAILRFSELSQRELEKWVLSLDANATSADPKSSPPSFLEQAILLTCKESGWVEVPDNFTVTIPLAIAPDGTLASIVEPVN